jgi:hypothetical protein
VRYTENFFAANVLVNRSFVSSFATTVLSVAALFAAVVGWQFHTKIQIQPLAEVFENDFSYHLLSASEIGAISQIGSARADRIAYIGWETSLVNLCELNPQIFANIISPDFHGETAKLVITEDRNTTIANAPKLSASVCNEVKLDPSKFKNVKATFDNLIPVLASSQTKRVYILKRLDGDTLAPKN